ncbi:glycerophosphodiester phosphodiesterase [Bacillus paranthracis]|uniref:glycerophosphodiester phosphodiesterase n=1 Tax=Bacillus paranthracis TaxID=2026186 RepID=UPI003D1F71A8
MKLNKWKNTIADRNFRNETNENWTILETTYTGVEEKSNEALESSKTAKEKSVEANDISKNVQEQLNTIVIAGDSGPEAAQARTDAKGNTSDTLKERLDVEQLQRLEFQSIQMKSKFDNTFELIAHRGFGKQFPENTMIATKLAAQLGANSLECDVQISSDGIPVVIHDDTVDRTTNGSGKVVEKSFLELRQLDAAKNFPYFSGEKIPSFEEWLQFAKGNSKFIYPEIKGYRQQSDIKIIIDLIVKYGLDTRCIIQSTYPDNLSYVRTINKQITLGYLVNDAQAFNQALVNATSDRNAVLLPNASLVYQNPSLIANARAEGVDIAVWTMETIEYMQRIKSLGITRFMCDFYMTGGEIL